MVDEAPVALVLHQRGQVLKANRVAAAYLGEDHPASVTRIDLMERIHPDDRADCLDAFARIRRPPHAMLVELGRNDLGRIAAPGGTSLPGSSGRG